MTNAPRPTRNEQREAARAKAREMREAQKRNASRRKLIVLLAVIVSVAVIGAGIFFAIANETAKPSATVAVPANMSFDGGIKIGKDLKVINDPTVQADVPNIIVYEDLQCPNCRDFENPNSQQLREWVASGKYTLQIHPITFLDGNSPNAYSSRAASAMMCVANSAPDKFFDYNSVLFANQPEEGTMGHSDNALAALAEKAGVTDSATLDCIMSARYQAYAINYTQDTVFQRNIPGTNLKVDGTPYIVMGGERFVGDWTNPAVIAQWVLSHTK
jgi:protein-disulfide isomerase